MAADEGPRQCDNNRPVCKKCSQSGRECLGYERETVFIIGTLEDGGRCSSHPPRVVKSKKAKASSSKAEAPPEQLELVTNQPLQPAWDDLISLTTGETTYEVRIAALHTSLQGVRRLHEDGSDTKFAVFFPSYTPVDVRPLPSEDDFELRYQCMVHLAPTDDGLGQSSETTVPTDSVCLFLYEVRLPEPESPPDMAQLTGGSTTHQSSSTTCPPGRIQQPRATASGSRARNTLETSPRITSSSASFATAR